MRRGVTFILFFLQTNTRQLNMNVTEYLIEDANGEVRGRASQNDRPQVTAMDTDELEEEEEGMSSRKARRCLSVDLRERSSNLAGSEAKKKPRHHTLDYCTLTEWEIAKELGKLDFACFREGTVHNPKRSLSLLDVRSAEKSRSDSDLCQLDSDPAPVLTRHLDGITGNSTIKKTVREVSQAFNESDSGSPTERKIPAHAQEEDDEDAPVDSAGETSQSSLDELLATIERDIDETRRTINNAQLLESAVRIKQGSSQKDAGSDMSGPSADLLNMKIRAMERMKKHEERLLESSGESDALGPKVFSLESAEFPADSSEMLNNQKNRSRGELDPFAPLFMTASCPSPELFDIHSHTIERMRKRKEQLREWSSHSRREAPTSSSETLEHASETVGHDSEVRKPKVIDFTLPCDDNSDLGTEISVGSSLESMTVKETRHSSSSDVESSSEQPPKSRQRIIDIFVEAGDDVIDSPPLNAGLEERWPITPEKWELPNVQSIARQFSRMIHNKQQVAEIRRRVNEAKRPLCSVDTQTLDAIPTLQVERVTKVTLESCHSGPSTETRVVRRRRRSLRRHRSGEESRRSSWSCDQQAETEGDRGMKERPKSVYVSQPSFETVKLLMKEGAEELENIDEDSEPMEMDGKEKDDVVIRGLVQHLVKLFEHS